mmetsp:Transcript_42416/g.122690  ORF Transcript_42416/g.122690 Transcript_42416/m.122690 type:complete len:256 (-) Transcript_42416:108-875(-)
MTSFPPPAHKRWQHDGPAGCRPALRQRSPGSGAPKSAAAPPSLARTPPICAAAPPFGAADAQTSRATSPALSGAAAPPLPMPPWRHKPRNRAPCRGRNCNTLGCRQLQDVRSPALPSELLPRPGWRWRERQPPPSAAKCLLRLPIPRAARMHTGGWRSAPLRRRRRPMERSLQRPSHSRAVIGPQVRANSLRPAAVLWRPLRSALAPRQAQHGRPPKRLPLPSPARPPAGRRRGRSSRSRGGTSRAPPGRRLSRK